MNRVLQSPPDAHWRPGQTKHPGPEQTHSYPAEGPDARGGEATPGGGVRGQRGRSHGSFLFLSVAWDDRGSQKKNKTLDQRANHKDDLESDGETDRKLETNAETLRATNDGTKQQTFILALQRRRWRFHMLINRFLGRWRDVSHVQMNYLKRWKSAWWCATETPKVYAIYKRLMKLNSPAFNTLFYRLINSQQRIQEWTMIYHKLQRN